MNVIRHSDSDFAEKTEQMLKASSLFDPEIERRTRAILDKVQAEGDAALVELTQKFDGANITVETLAITHAESMAASLSAGAELRAAVEEASKNICAFARRSKRRGWQTKNAHGAVVGEKFDPIRRVGVYIPGGTAPLVSTALMTALLARVAGCPEIVVCTPPRKDGSINPALLFAARAAGATEIYRVGGAQAIAALAYGTQSIRQVDKIFGPGNAYVVAAKRLTFGHVAIDLLPGPSEVLVIADDSANPKFAAADLLAQAEHGSGHERIWLVTTSGKVLKAVEKEMQRQLPRLKRKELIQQTLDANCWLVQVSTMAEAVKLANRIAAEHCEIMAKRPRNVAAQLTTSGAIFIGRYSPTVLGDYIAGPSHTLPTGGAGRSFPGLTVDQFQRRTSLVEYTRPALKRALNGVRTFAAMEGLDAHGQSAEVRF